MVRIVLALALGLPWVATYAQDTAPSFTTEPDQMKACAHEAESKSLQGRERAAFLSSCLKGTEAWGRIKTCNQAADKKGLKGETRERFVGRCWRGQR